MSIFKVVPKHVKLTPAQKEALKKVELFLTSGSEQSRFLLAGYAGTGKTTIAKYICYYSNAVVLAPTHSALTRLRDKIGYKIPGNKEFIEYSTVHSAIYKLNKNASTIFKPKFVQNDNTLDSKVYIVDESSMLDSTQFNILYQKLEQDSKIIFLGDGFQLEPIFLDPQMFNPKVNHKYFHKDHKIELVDIVRYNGVLLDVATQLRNNKKSMFTLPENDEVKIVTSFSKNLARQTRNNENAIILVPTNALRVKYNRAMRILKYGKNIDYLQPNDKLICICNSSDYVNGETVNIKDSTYVYLETFNASLVDISRNKDIKVTIQVYTLEAYYLLLLPYYLEPSISTEAITAVIPKSSLLYNKIIDKDSSRLRSNVIVATYGYATSVHKSQGNEWDYVYIHPTKLSNNWNHTRWFYTAITRAKKSVEIIKSNYLNVTHV